MNAHDVTGRPSLDVDDMSNWLLERNVNINHLHIQPSKNGQVTIRAWDAVDRKPIRNVSPSIYQAFEAVVIEIYDRREYTRQAEEWRDANGVH